MNTQNNVALLYKVSIRGRVRTLSIFDIPFRHEVRIPGYSLVPP